MPPAGHCEWADAPLAPPPMVADVGACPPGFPGVPLPSRLQRLLGHLDPIRHIYLAGLHKGGPIVSLQGLHMLPTEAVAQGK